MKDAVDINAVALLPSIVRDWPVTTEITSLVTGKQGLDVQFSKRDGLDWPDVVPAGWTGPVYYTVWLGAELPDGIHLAASLNVFRGQPAGSGAGDVTDFTLKLNPLFAPGQYPQNLWYLDRALAEHDVVEGEKLYLMVTAGGWRGATALSVQERSNIVTFTASSTAKTFTFQSTPVDPPVVVPPVQPPPSTGDLNAVLKRLDDMEALMVLRHQAVIGLLERGFSGTATNRYLGTITISVTPTPPKA